MKKMLFNTSIYLFSALILSACESNFHGIDTCDDKDHITIIEDRFTNPILPRGADPWVTQNDGKYYFTYTQGGKVVLYETDRISELELANPYDAWVPPPGTMYSSNLWAPELHAINGKWYIYVSADNGSNANHRMYVIENESADPMQGEWVFKGKIADATDQWAIDGTVLDHQGQLYMLWSGGPAGAPPQEIFIATMSDPWTIDGEKVKIASPTHPWEMNGNPINEGPQILVNPSGQILVVYSASGYWVDTYCLGVLSLQEGGDPLNPSHWTKKPEPIFSMRAESGAYGPGHNGFFKSPDGTEDWIIYHARSRPGGGNNNGRNARIQPFTWLADGTPNFGEPAKIGQQLRRPSGEMRRLHYRKDNWSIVDYSSEELVNTRLAERLIDNDLSSFWITRYSTNPTNYPDHWITIDMGAELATDGFTINQKSGDRKIKQLEILVSNDNEIWESVGDFDLKSLDMTMQYLPLAQRRNIRYFKLVPISGHDNQLQPGLAEVGTFRYED